MRTVSYFPKHCDTYVLIILVLNVEQVYFTTDNLSEKNVGWAANSVDSDKTHRSVASALGLHC